MEKVLRRGKVCGEYGSELALGTIDDDISNLDGDVCIYKIHNPTPKRTNRLRIKLESLTSHSKGSKDFDFMIK